MSDVKINNVTVTGGEYCNDTSFSAGIYTTDDIISNLEVQNCIVYSNSAYYDFHLRGSSSGAAITNNDSYRASGISVRDRIAGGDRTYTSAEISNWNSDKTWASGNIGLDPQLDYNYHIAASSPQALKDGGIYIGTHNEGLKEDSIWSPPLSVTTINWEHIVDSGKQGMGAYVYGSSDIPHPPRGLTIIGITR
jgi:hypothetical protein